MTCIGCLYNDKCDEDEICEYYFPVGDEYEDEYIDAKIESGREDYYSDWFGGYEDCEDVISSKPARRYTVRLII